MPARRYGLRMAASSVPHLRGDTLVFVADNNVWTAPVSGGRAYRLTADDVPVGTPRLSPDGARVAWSALARGRGGGLRRRRGRWVGAAPDVVGGARAAVGWTPSGDVLAVTLAGQPWAG